MNQTKRSDAECALISAAPDMLEALEALVEVIEHHELKDLVALQWAKDAIAKATGEK